MTRQSRNSEQVEKKPAELGGRVEIAVVKQLIILIIHFAYESTNSA